MDVSVLLSARTIADDDIRGRTVVVIDVLRASTTIATALHNGARAIVPVPDMAHAGKLAAAMDQSSYLLGGERGGEKIEGYHLGNSPLEYTRDVVEGKTIIFNTTNGSGAISAATEAAGLVVGSFLNADRVVRYCREAERDVTLICAGWRGRVALEDTLCAGLLLHRLWNGKEPGLVSDAAHIAFTQYATDQDMLETAIRRCNHGQRLKEKGLEADLAYCLQIDTLPVLPFYKDNRLILHREKDREPVA